MSEFDQLYREVILDHYKNPRGHGLLDDADAQAEGQNPLCGDEVTVSLRFDGDDDRRGRLRGPRLRDLAGGDVDADRDRASGGTPSDVARMPKEELLEEIGIPLTPVRLKCAMLGLGVLKVALHKSKGTPLPDEWTQGDDLTMSSGDRRRLPGGGAAARAREDRLVGPDRDRRLQLRRQLLRDRGPLLARRRAALRGRVGAGRVRRRSARATARASTSRRGGR